MESSVSDIWRKATTKLRKKLNEDTFDRWMAGIVPLGMNDSHITLGVSNEIICLFLQRNYYSLIADAIGDLVKKPVTLSFESGHAAAPPALPPAEEEKKPRRTAGKPGRNADMRGGGERSKDDPAAVRAYNRRFTFHTFVIGQNNKFAHAACYAVARNLGKAYNPLFIHGGTGLGKTHLLQAIAHDVMEGRDGQARVEYLSSEEFFNRYIYALQEKRLPRFRNHFRKIDLLLIDDVHFFTGKEQLQEEFFHTFNALHDGHRQIVLTSDRPPHEIGGLEQRLVSRFEWGLTTEVQIPDLETRVAILRKKQAEYTTRLDDEVLLWVATQIRANIRQLEGALIRLVAYASITGTPIDTATAEQLLRPLLDQEKAGALTIEQIQRLVAEYFDIRLADMTSKKRPQSIATPRQVAMYFSRQMTDSSSTAIGESFNRNHATVLHAVNSVEKKSQTDERFRDTLVDLEKRLKRHSSS